MLCEYLQPSAYLSVRKKLCPSSHFLSKYFPVRFYFSVFLWSTLPFDTYYYEICGWPKIWEILKARWKPGKFLPTWQLLEPLSSSLPVVQSLFEKNVFRCFEISCLFRFISELFKALIMRCFPRIKASGLGMKLLESQLCFIPESLPGRP